MFGLASGAPADIARAMPVLEQLCRRIEPIGALGSGATMKLAVNLPLLVYWQALGEALAICKPPKRNARDQDNAPLIASPTTMARGDAASSNSSEVSRRAPLRCPPAYDAKHVVVNSVSGAKTWIPSVTPAEALSFTWLRSSAAAERS